MIESDYEPVEIRIDGVFDVPAAQAVVRALQEAPRGRLVRIDLTRILEFHDFAIALLGQALGARSQGVIVDGLRPHQRRVLAYLGLPGAAELQL